MPNLGEDILHKGDGRDSSTLHEGDRMDGRNHVTGQSDDEQAEDKDKRAQVSNTVNPNAAYMYQMTRPGSVLLKIRGTFWPLVYKRYELYLFPLAHTILVIRSNYWTKPEDSDDEQWWGESSWMLPWATLGLLTPLMTFFLVFFLGQCYTRFISFFTICTDIEAAVQEVTMQMLCHIQDEQVRWDIVRYVTAAAMIIYFRVTKLALHMDAMVSYAEWERLLTDEKEFLGLDHYDWERVMGWPRTREQAKAYTERLAEGLGLSAQHPTRRSAAPPLLKREEIDLLRKYPGGMMTFVLLTWALQTAKSTNLPPPFFGAMYASCSKLRAAAYKVRQQLSMPVPLPYFHALNLLQNINYALYTYALCSFESYLTPFVLFIVILITVGMREVAAALSNPFGDDDVDFPVNKWIMQLRSMAIVAHPSNVPCVRPAVALASTDVVAPLLAPHASKSVAPTTADEHEEEEDEEGDDDGGDGGDE